ncbi:hypothetical protein LQZ18_13955 [Lachnospiraceae bacterium ZAX-1]
MDKELKGGCYLDNEDSLRKALDEYQRNPDLDVEVSKESEKMFEEFLEELKDIKEHTTRFDI